MPHYTARRRAGFKGRRQGGIRTYERRKEGDRGSEKDARETRVVQRGRGGGDFEHAPQPPRFFSPGTEKGDRARHMPGGSACASCVCTLRTYVFLRLCDCANARGTDLSPSNENQPYVLHSGRSFATIDPVISRPL